MRDERFFSSLFFVDMLSCLGRNKKGDRLAAQIADSQNCSALLEIVTYD